MFIQVIQGRCRDADRLHQLSDEWRDTLGPGAEGWLGGTYGITDEGQFVAVVRFESRDAATKNSTRPEQGEWWQKMSECFEGEVSFHSDDVHLILDGGSDDAGFVQVMQGRLSDPDRFRKFMTQPMDALREARPEIIGGTIAIEPDGSFTETICFTSEEAARAGEAKEMPEDMRREVEEEFSVMEDVTYLDLRHPWFSSAQVSGAQTSGASMA
jgi:hypothetical protein